MQVRSSKRRASVFVACALAVIPMQLAAFQVLPRVSDVDRALAKASKKGDWFGQFLSSSALPYLKNPVHEAITLVALGCQANRGDEIGCVRGDTVAQHQMVLYGVRWPDDPPFRMSTSSPPRSKHCNVKVTLRSTAQPRCWLHLFDDAGKRAAGAPAGKPAFGPGDMLLYRSHYGDLQFMHAMASYDGETAEETRAKMKMWAQFTWGVATRRVRTDVFLRDAGIEGLGTYFPGDMTATNLFATGIGEARPHLDQVALGVMLHMVQDSFSGAHASRNESTGAKCALPSAFEAPGKIGAFHGYARQDADKHDQEDTPNALKVQTLDVTPNAVDVSRDIVALWKRQAEWSEVEGFFNCVFDLSNPDAPAGPGAYARKR